MGVCFREILPSTQNWSSVKAGLEFCISSLETGGGNLHCAHQTWILVYLLKKKKTKQKQKLPRLPRNALGSRHCAGSRARPHTDCKNTVCTHLRTETHRPCSGDPRMSLGVGAGVGRVKNSFTAALTFELGAEGAQLARLHRAEGPHSK